MSGSNPNYSQQLNTNCPPGTRPRTGASRPFTRADFNSSSMDSGCKTIIENTTHDFSTSMYDEKYFGQGRPLNPLTDISGNRLGRPTNHNQAQYKKPSQRENHFNLEEEMARNKEIALCRLRAEKSAASAATTSNSPNYERSGQKMGIYREKGIGSKAEIQRWKNQEGNNGRNACLKPERGNNNAGRPVDVNRVYDYNMPAYSPAGVKGRTYETERDLTFRRLNLPTPKEQRARSCPTPVQHDATNSFQQRLPRICPRPSQSVCVSPTRSVNPSDANVSRYATPMQQAPQKSQEMRAKYPVAPVCPPTHTPVYSNADNTVDSRGIITRTLTTKTTTKLSSPQQRPIFSTSQKSPDKSLNIYGDPTQRQEYQNNSQRTEYSSLHIDRDYAQTPPRGFARSPLKTPRKPGNVTDQHATTKETHALENDNMTVPRTNSSKPQQPRSPQICRAPAEGSDYYNVSMLDDSSQYKRGAQEFPKKSFIDLTEDTQYICEDIDISGQDLLPQSAYTTKRDGNRRMYSWTIPPEDLTCLERTDYEECESQHPDLNLAMMQTPPNETLGADFDFTEYLELPPTKVCPPQTCPPCEQPKASLFRCLAKKLSSTYEFISSLLAPQKPAGHADQVCDATASDTSPSSNAIRPHDETLGLRDLFATQCNNATNASTSIRECANAKRCGRVQFDSTDKCEVQNAHQSAIRKAEIENLVNDTFCPGIIQDTIDGRENFNNHSFSISLSKETKENSPCKGLPTKDPMTLLEAFSLRTDMEREQINKDLNESLTEVQIKDSIHKYFDTQTPNDLNRSLKSLFLAECLQDHEQNEKSQGTSLEAEVQKLASTFPDNAQVKLVAYTGHTKPAANQKTEK